MKIIKLYITSYRELFNADGRYMVFDHKAYLLRCQLLVFISPAFHSCKGNSTPPDASFSTAIHNNKQKHPFANTNCI